MRLIIECDHGMGFGHWYLGHGAKAQFCEPVGLTDPDAILAALAEAGVLEAEQQYAYAGYLWTGEPNVVSEVRYVSPWKEAK